MAECNSLSEKFILRLAEELSSKNKRRLLRNRALQREHQSAIDKNETAPSPGPSRKNPKRKRVSEYILHTRKVTSTYDLTTTPDETVVSLSSSPEPGTSMSARIPNPGANAERSRSHRFNEELRSRSYSPISEASSPETDAPRMRPVPPINSTELCSILRLPNNKRGESSFIPMGQETREAPVDLTANAADASPGLSTRTGVSPTSRTEQAAPLLQTGTPTRESVDRNKNVEQSRSFYRSTDSMNGGRLVAGPPLPLQSEESRPLDDDNGNTSSECPASAVLKEDIEATLISLLESDPPSPEPVHSDTNVEGSRSNHSSAGSVNSGCFAVNSPVPQQPQQSDQLYDHNNSSNNDGFDTVPNLPLPPRQLPIYQRNRSNNAGDFVGVPPLHLQSQLPGQLYEHNGSMNAGRFVAGQTLPMQSQQFGQLYDNNSNSAGINTVPPFCLTPQQLQFYYQNYMPLRESVYPDGNEGLQTYRHSAGSNNAGRFVDGSSLPLQSQYYGQYDHNDSSNATGFDTVSQVPVQQQPYYQYNPSRTANFYPNIPQPTADFMYPSTDPLSNTAFNPNMPMPGPQQRAYTNYLGSDHPSPTNFYPNMPMPVPQQMTNHNYPGSDPRRITTFHPNMPMSVPQRRADNNYTGAEHSRSTVVNPNMSMPGPQRRANNNYPGSEHPRSTAVNPNMPMPGPQRRANNNYPGSEQPSSTAVNPNMPMPGPQRRANSNYPGAEHPRSTIVNPNMPMPDLQRMANNNYPGTEHPRPTAVNPNMPMPVPQRRADNNYSGSDPPKTTAVNRNMPMPVAKRTAYRNNKTSMGEIPVQPANTNKRLNKVSEPMKMPSALNQCRHCFKICKSATGLKIHLSRTCEKKKKNK